VIIVPIAFVLGCLSCHSPPDWDASFFGRRLAWLLMILGFVCCVVSPFFTRFSLWLWFVLALAGALMVGLIWVVSVAVL